MVNEGSSRIEPDGLSWKLRDLPVNGPPSDRMADTRLMRSVRVEAAAAVTSSAILAVGATVLLISRHRLVGRQGWFAYAPLSRSRYTPPVHLFSSTGVKIGVLLIGLGLVLVSGLAGYLIGRRGLPDRVRPSGPDGSRPA
jgi:hypothetical protein